MATGSTILAAHINTDLDAIYADYNGNITNANIAASAAIAQSKLSFSNPTSIASTAWKAVTANPAIGNGTWAASYETSGKYVRISYSMIAGNTTTFGTGAWQIDLPINTAKPCVLTGMVFQNTTGNVYSVVARADSGASQLVRIYRGDGTTSVLSSSVPVSWTTSDFLYLSGVYEGV